MEKPRILVVDDEPSDNAFYCQGLRGAGYAVQSTRDAEQALKLASEQHFDAIVLDLLITKPHGWQGTDVTGIDLLRRLKELDGTIEVIIVTRAKRQDFDTAARIAGARDVLEKPVSILQLRNLIAHAIDRRFLLAASHLITPDWFVSSNIQIEACLQEAQIWAWSDQPMLIVGEPGVGKQTLAEIIHNNSRALKGKLVIVACGDLNAAMEIVTVHGKRAFDMYRAEAEHGTLLLKDVHLLSWGQQTEIERLIQLGQDDTDTKPPYDVRVIATATAEIHERYQDKSFWDKLYYQLTQATIELPPLRERKDDILKLAGCFLRRTNLAIDIAKDAQDILEQHDYATANIDELEQLLWVAAQHAHGGTIQREHITAQFTHSNASTAHIGEETADEEEIEALREQLMWHKKRLRVLEEQAAKLGSSTPAATLMEIKETRQHIDALLAKLKKAQGE